MFDLLKRPFAGKGIDEGTARSRSWFGARVAALFERSGIVDSDWEELEELLIAGDVGPRYAQTTVEQLKQRVNSDRIRDPQGMFAALRATLVQTLKVRDPSFASGGRPTVVLVVGVNGSGKTTTAAKLARLLQQMGKTSVLAAADTFRAGAIDQLKIWGERLGVRVVAQKPGSDPAAVAYDAAAAALSAGADYLIVDTAGRLQTDRNLMSELQKVARVLGKQVDKAPHEVLLVLDGLTGQDGLAQAREFCAKTGVTGIVLAKLDGSAKGGIAFAITSELGVPLKFAGTGESIDDLAPFDPELFVDSLLRREE